MKKIKRFILFLFLLFQLSGYAHATPLHDAAWKGDIQKVLALLYDGADINAKTDKSGTPLHVAAYNGHAEIVRLLIEKGADMNAKKDEDEATPLHIAAYNSLFEIVWILIEKGADMNAKNVNESTPLHVAVYNGHTKIVRLLIEKGADINAKNKFGKTPLNYAEERRHTHIADILRETEKKLNVRENSVQTPMGKRATAVAMAYETELRSLSDAMAENIAKAGKKRIAVVDFTDLQGNITELGRFIAEEISVDFTMTAKGFEVIDRNHLNRILAEHKLSVSGIVDQKTVQKLGQIAGVDAIVTGSTTPLENSVRVVCKVIATDTARVISAGKGDIAKTKAIGELLGKGIGTGTTGKTGTTTPVEKPKALANVETGDFTFEAKGCKRQGPKVICTIAVTALGSGYGLWFYIDSGDFLLIDDLGNSYRTAYGWFAGERGRMTLSSRNIPAGIPMNLVLEFSEVVETARYVNVIMDFAGGGRNSRGKATLRNIPLTK